jgi:hypothetical protein
MQYAIIILILYLIAVYWYGFRTFFLNDRAPGGLFWALLSPIVVSLWWLCKLACWIKRNRS